MLDPTPAAPNLTALILSSAAIGALVSSVITIIGQYFDRSAKKKELLFNKAVELAQSHVELLKTLAKTGTRAVKISPYIVYTRVHHRQLKSLYDDGKLSPGLERQYHKEIFGDNPDVED
jgi:hypothetical protein